MDRFISAMEPIFTPLVIVAMTAVGSWGVWVSVASYDSSQHLNDYAETTAELGTMVDSLREVEIGLVEQRVTTDAVLNAQTTLLAEILREVREP